MDEYKQFIEENWGLSCVSINNTIKSKGDRMLLIIKSTEGRFVLKAFGSSLSEDEINRNTFALSYMVDKEHLLTPKILTTVDGKFYSKYNDRFIYIMEYVEGKQLNETVEDEYLLGQAAARLHAISDYPIHSSLVVPERIQNMYNRFHDYSFKRKYDDVVSSLPNFDLLKQSFIHTDIGPHNALKSTDGQIIFIDLDDAGKGSTYIDIGYPLITQFVRYHDSDRIGFNFELAKAFYKGYFSKSDMSNSDREFIFYGAVFMQLMYMPSYGENGILPMWNILDYAVTNKEKLLSAML